MFSQTVEYALRAVVCLATEEGRLQGAAEISETMDVPAGYLAKVLQQLVKAEIITSNRGKGGGFLLADLQRRYLCWMLSTQLTRSRESKNAR